ncbi:MAG TPA: LssY C-terminal domain-containing protein [Candidatus Binataceae bacterium]
MSSHSQNALARMSALAATLATLFGSGCATVPSSPTTAPFEQHLVTKQNDNLTVSVAVLTDAEAEQYFGVPLGKHDVQAVWLKVHNQTDHQIGLLYRNMDPEYFPPYEVAYLNHRPLQSERNRNLDELFDRSRFPAFVAPGDTATGFVFTSRTEGAKFVNVEFWHDLGLTRDGFYMKLPSGKFDFEEADFANTYAPGEVKALDLAQLHQQLEELPCCTSDSSGGKNGDPVNFVMIGDEDAVMGALAGQGWDPTHVIAGHSVGLTVKSFLFGSEYRYSPVSRLYYFSRGQDLALQKIRGTIHQRNHLRLWRAPLSFQGKDLWVGQISRDIGVRFTWATPTLTTHKIDPDVDDAREYLVQDMFASGYLQSLAYVRGVGAAARETPRENLTGDPYFTDGLRAVMFIANRPVPIDKITLIEWGEPLPQD